MAAAVVVQSQAQVCRPVHVNVQVAAAEYQGMLLTAAAVHYSSRFKDTKTE